MRFDDGTADRQAHARALPFRRKECIEDRARFFGRHPTPVSLTESAFGHPGRLRLCRQYANVLCRYSNTETPSRHQHIAMANWLAGETARAVEHVKFSFHDLQQIVQGCYPFDPPENLPA
jgi:hypothetical protein